MRDVADRTGIRSNVVKSDKSFWNHSELTSGPIVLTASTVQTPCGPVDTSDFRLTLARSNQEVLWPEPFDEPAEGAPLYVLLLHSRSRWSYAATRSVLVICPARRIWPIRLQISMAMPMR